LSKAFQTASIDTTTVEKPLPKKDISKRLSLQLLTQTFSMLVCFLVLVCLIYIIMFVFIFAFNKGQLMVSVYKTWGLLKDLLWSNGGVLPVYTAFTVSAIVVFFVFLFYVNFNKNFVTNMLFASKEKNNQDELFRKYYILMIMLVGLFNLMLFFLPFSLTSNYEFAVHFVTMIILILTTIASQRDASWWIFYVVIILIIIWNVVNSDKEKMSELSQYFIATYFSNKTSFS
jgi:hypothetical protein